MNRYDNSKPMTSQPSAATIGRDRIQALIPHGPSMCLLDRVLSWDALTINCETRSHLDVDNPLRFRGRLSAICGIEYAAQALALHGALRSAGAAPFAVSATNQVMPPQGYLASVRDICCNVRFLEACTTAIDVSAELVFDDATRVIYDFALHSVHTPLVTGRAAVVLA
jgi:predicted hotdog family 3-hydroxylacyl-ACP dehydratase